MNSPHLVTNDEIAARAHTIWEQCGRPEGCEQEHWFRAERELQKERQQVENVRAGLSEPVPERAVSDAAYPAKKNTPAKSPPGAELARLPKDPHVSETPGPPARTSRILPGPDPTIGPSQVPADATLPPSEPVIPGKGRPHK